MWIIHIVWSANLQYRVQQIVVREDYSNSTLPPTTFIPFYTYDFLYLHLTILFLKGLHILARIRNVTNLALTGVGPDDSKIQCEGPTGLYFKQMIQGDLTISNLTVFKLWKRVSRWPTLWWYFLKLSLIWTWPIKLWKTTLAMGYSQQSNSGLHWRKHFDLWL